MSVVGVPKSIDNDVLFVDRTFGFDSAVEAGARVIANGYVEARSGAGASASPLRHASPEDLAITP